MPRKHFVAHEQGIVAKRLKQRDGAMDNVAFTTSPKRGKGIENHARTHGEEHSEPSGKLVSPRHSGVVSIHLPWWTIVFLISQTNSGSPPTSEPTLGARPPRGAPISDPRDRKGGVCLIPRKRGCGGVQQALERVERNEEFGGGTAHHGRNKEHILEG